MHRVIEKFVDLEDNHHIYEIGDVYPREGYSPKNKRIKELCSEKNKRKVPLIASIDDINEEITDDEKVDEIVNEEQQSENAEDPSEVVSEKIEDK